MKLQRTVENIRQPEPIRSVASIASEMNAIHASKLAMGDADAAAEKTYTIWSVHLLSFFGELPPAGELDFLDKAGVPYSITRALVNGAS